MKKEMGGLLFISFVISIFLTGFVSAALVDEVVGKISEIIVFTIGNRLADSARRICRQFTSLKVDSGRRE